MLRRYDIFLNPQKNSNHFPITPCFLFFHFRGIIEKRKRRRLLSSAFFIYIKGVIPFTPKTRCCPLHAAAFLHQHPQWTFGCWMTAARRGTSPGCPPWVWYRLLYALLALLLFLFPLFHYSLKCYLRLNTTFLPLWM